MPRRRRLGITETSYKFHHDDSNGYSLISTMVRISGPLSPEMLKKALTYMQNRHPLLRARLKGTDGKYDYMDVEDEPIEFPFTIIEKSADEQWRSVFEQNMANLFIDGECPWRVYFLYGGEGDAVDHDLVVGLQHFISDGISSGLFFGELLGYCCRIAEGDEPEVTSMPLLPAMEELLRSQSQSTWTGFLRFVFQSWVLPLVRTMRYLHNYETYVRPEQRRGKNIYREFDGRTLNRLIEVCRKNDTTITGLLTAALIKAASEVSGHAGSKGRQGQITGTAYNARRLCNREKVAGQLACFVGNDVSDHRFKDNTSIWELARSYNSKLNSTIMKRGRFPVEFNKKMWTSMLKTGKRWPFKKKFNFGVGVTNIGRLDYPARCGPFLMKEFHFCACQNGGELMVLMHVATLEDKMFTDFHYVEPLLSFKTAQKIADTCNSILESVITE